MTEAAGKAEKGDPAKAVGGATGVAATLGGQTAGRSDDARPLGLGFLHLGRPESGVRRYGRMLATEAATRPDVAVTEADAGLLEGRAGGLRRRGVQLASTDVVQLQWNPRGWGRSARAAYRFREFQLGCRRPLVVTLHDVFPRESFKARWLVVTALNLRYVGRRADRLVVHSDAEVERLHGIVPAEKVRVIPHFVEHLELPRSPVEARARLGVEGRRVVTLLGFVFGRKGHRTLLEAVPLLPPEVLVVFAGGSVAGRDWVAESLKERAAELKVGPDRLRFTGYLSDADFLDWVAATHLAVLPFRDLSASGSFSTWIAAGKPILASDLPGFREYDARVPGALRLFGPIEPEPLAEAITAQLATELVDPDPRVLELATELSVPRTVDRYLAVDREAAGAG